MKRNKDSPKRQLLLPLVLTLALALSLAACTSLPEAPTGETVPSDSRNILQPTGTATLVEPEEISTPGEPPEEEPEEEEPEEEEEEEREGREIQMFDEPRLARIKTDPEYYAGIGLSYKSRMEEPDWPRGFSNDAYPQVIQLWRTPNGGEDHPKLNYAWLQYIKALNNSNHIFSNMYTFFNKREDWVDPDNPSEVARAENIAFGGQVVRVVGTKNKSALIETLFVGDGPPNASQVNHKLTPWLVHEVTAIHVSGSTSGNDDYIPILSVDRQGVWIPLDRLIWLE